ncbi:hypothetical protein PsYK624_156960 [Phanerochaete sordida]|uniref:Uncharacterized protein n=1 Tax=Phanerochaete sordida TaxID=48140 RepID=A0A9P3LL86_9APHY|nr:hypothetical protein PsYK624_156960 [Phanerochaete sordida]
MLLLKSQLTFWTDTACDSFVTLVPQRRLKSDGQWSKSFFGFMMGQHEVFVDAPDGKRFYLGTYQSTGGKALRDAVVRYRELPEETKEILVSKSGVEQHRDQVAAKYEDGSVAPKRVYYRRVGFGQGMYTRLCDPDLANHRARASRDNATMEMPDVTL